MQWTTDQVLAAAPDAQVAAAGRKLAEAKHWRNQGCDDDAIWGECQGSALYQVRVARADLAAKCSCPSRKFPCKHAVGLLLLTVQAPAAVPRGEQPEWVSSWIGKREETAARKAKPAEEKKADPEAQAKRAAQRHERVLDGLESLDLWMADLVRNGLAELETKGVALWEQQAARLVDAQAPALATRVRALSTVAGASADWAERLLGGLGRIALLTEAYRRLDQLHPHLQADVRAAVGWTLNEEEVHAAGERVSDEWLILGSTVEDGDRVRTQRTWLQGLKSGRTALVLQFAAGGAQFTQLLMPGLTIDADLVFWPSAWPQRALIAESRAQRHAAGLHAHPSFDGLFDAAATACAAQPWLWRIGVALDGVVPAVDARGEWRLRDRDGAVLPLDGRDHWRLLALSGGNAVGLTAEWDGYVLAPLAVVIDGTFHRLTGVH
jgi:SWIM zinc finger